MICIKCGREHSEDCLICENCGSPVNEELPQKEAVDQPSNQQAYPGFLMGSDGILRWVYEMNMWKNPNLVITIWKVLLLSALAPALLMFFLTLSDGLGAAILVFLKIMGIVAGILTGLLLLAYPFVAMIHGGKYCVMFEMDDNSVKHIQMQKQFKKSQLLSIVVVLAGLMAGNIPATAAGILAGSKQCSLSRFEKVKSIMVNEKRHVIYVNEKLSHNHVYAGPADFAFVSNSLIRRCKKAKVTYT